MVKWYVVCVVGCDFRTWRLCASRQQPGASEARPVPTSNCDSTVPCTILAQMLTFLGRALTLLQNINLSVGAFRLFFDLHVKNSLINKTATTSTEARTNFLLCITGSEGQKSNLKHYLFSSSKMEWNHRHDLRRFYWLLALGQSRKRYRFHYAKTFRRPQPVKMKACIPNHFTSNQCNFFSSA